MRCMTPLSARHRPSGRNPSFCCAGLSFTDYRQHMLTLLAEAHGGKPDADAIIAGNAPFELVPPGNARRGVLLVHGLSDSPYHMRHLAAFFQRNGWRVMAPLLPGHGTRPGDLLHIRWQEWAQTVAWGAEQLAGEVDELYLAGYSAGAALSLLQASRDARVRGLFLFSPALEITRRAAYANLHRLYSWLKPEAAWVGLMPDGDPFKYESFPKNAAAQMYALIRALPQRGMDLPVFAAASADDATVHAQATLRFMRQTRHPASRLVWYARGPVAQANVEWVDSSVPERRILSGAHTAVVMPPDDPHYGERGDYANCLHYCGQDEVRYATCRTRPEWLGEVTPDNLARGVLRRLTWNPHYAQMEASMQAFIGRLP